MKVPIDPTDQTLVFGVQPPVQNLATLSRKPGGGLIARVHLVELITAYSVISCVNACALEDLQIIGDNGEAVGLDADATWTARFAGLTNLSVLRQHLGRLQDVDQRIALYREAAPPQETLP